MKTKKKQHSMKPLSEKEKEECLKEIYDELDRDQLFQEQQERSRRKMMTDLAWRYENEVVSEGRVQPKHRYCVV